MTMLAGAPNFRDLGGCVTAAGRTVRRGRLFRSQVLTGATDQDLDVLRRLGIGAVLDLRDPEERHRRNSCPPGVSWQPIAVEASPSEGVIHSGHVRRWVRDPGFNAAKARSLVIDMYRRMPGLYAPHLGALFGWLAGASRPPVLIHCEAGKDRTGFVCAVLLLSLGARVEVVVADYLLSQDRYRVAALRELVGEELRPNADEALSVLATVATDYLDAALREIDVRHGSIEGYLRDAAGVTGEQLDALRSNLLER